MKKHLGIKRIAALAVLTAAALTVFAIEARLPSLAPIPGVKLGLANIVTLWALVMLGPIDAALVLFARILLGSLFAGSATTLLYSLSGGALCYLVSLVFYKLVTDKQIWVLGVLGAIAHNIGQLIAASLVMRSAAVWSYAPVLLISAIITGAFTGMAAQLLYQRLKKAGVIAELASDNRSKNKENK